MTINNIIYIRSELNKNECRTPIIPIDIPVLIQHGFNIYVESSSNRIFSDEEYEKDHKDDDSNYATKPKQKSSNKTKTKKNKQSSSVSRKKYYY